MFYITEIVVLPLPTIIFHSYLCIHSCLGRCNSFCVFHPFHGEKDRVRTQFIVEEMLHSARFLPLSSTKLFRSGIRCYRAYVLGENACLHDISIPRMNLVHTKWTNATMNSVIFSQFLSSSIYLDRWKRSSTWVNSIYMLNRRFHISVCNLFQLNAVTFTNGTDEWWLIEPRVDYFARIALKDMICSNSSYVKHSYHVQRQLISPLNLI